MHYYKRNLGDYAKKAGRLSMLQHGSYTLLIDACYDREQFPTMEEAIEWTWASTTEEIEAVQFVLRKFFMLENGVYIQTRIQEELAEYRLKAETNKRIALERETNRKLKETNRAPVVNEASPNHKPITINQEPLLKPLRRKSAPMPSGFKLNEVSQAYAQDRKLNVSEELVAFANWHTAKGSTFKDWQAAWRTWCDKAVEFGRSKGGAPPNRDAARQAAANSIFRDENIQHLMGVRKNESSIDAKFSRID